jgi:hypothetical protein
MQKFFLKAIRETDNLTGMNKIVDILIIYI